VNHALGYYTASIENTVLKIVIDTPQYVKYLSVKNAAELCIKAGDHLSARLKSRYKKQTGNDIDQHMRDHISNAKSRIVQVLVRKALAKSGAFLEALVLGEIVSKPDLVTHLSVEDDAALCISAGNNSNLNELKHKYKSATSRGVDEEIRRIKHQETQPSVSLFSGF
jgi:hypothetical protein